MKRIAAKLRALAADQAGQSTIEWALLLGTFCVAILVRWPGMSKSIMGLMVGLVSDIYERVSFLETLPFP